MVAPGGEPQSQPGGRYGRLSGSRWSSRGGRFGGRTASSYYANAVGDEAVEAEEAGIEKKFSYESADAGMNNSSAVMADNTNSTSYPGPGSTSNGVNDNSHSAGVIAFECDSSSADEYEPEDPRTFLSAPPSQG